MKFEETISKLKSDLKGLLNENSTTEFIEKVSSLDKQIDEAVSAHERTAKELQDTKGVLVNYVKETGFAKPTSDDPTKVESPKSLDDIMKESLEEIIKEEKK